MIEFKPLSERAHPNNSQPSISLFIGTIQLEKYNYYKVQKRKIMIVQTYSKCTIYLQTGEGIKGSGRRI
jgi:hypothetical protein